MPRLSPLEDTAVSLMPELALSQCARSRMVPFSLHILFPVFLVSPITFHCYISPCLSLILGSASHGLNRDAGHAEAFAPR